MLSAPSRRRRWRHGLLWDSYNIGIVTVSKTYAPGGTSRAPTGQGWSHYPIRGLIQRKPPSRKCAELAHRNNRDKEHLMWDVVMLALGLGFFVVAIGYTYACERL